eukprot:SAG31_NODE_30_length_32545_cov_9.378999_27_plen_51_part_00
MQVLEYGTAGPGTAVKNNTRVSGYLDTVPRRAGQPTVYTPVGSRYVLYPD